MRQSVDEFAAPPRRVRIRERDKKMRNAHARDPVLRVKSRYVSQDRENIFEAAPCGKGSKTVFHRPRELSSLSCPFTRPRLITLTQRFFPSNLSSHNSRHGMTHGSRAQPLNSRSSFQPRISQPEVPSTRIKPSAFSLNCFPL